MIRLHKERHGIGKWLVPRKPARLRVPVRAHDGQRLDACVKTPRDGPCPFFRWKKPVFVEQCHSISPFRTPVSFMAAMYTAHTPQRCAVSLLIAAKRSITAEFRGPIEHS
jgi:hypothetical protein